MIRRGAPGSPENNGRTWGHYRLKKIGLHSRIAKGAGGKGPRQKTPKIVKKCQKVFRHFSTIFVQGKKNVKNRQKASKRFSTLFDNLRAAPFFRPLLGGSDAMQSRISDGLLEVSFGSLVQKSHRMKKKRKTNGIFP